eukprot:4698954-Pleurochrysis_carterae.AAC.1
METVQVATQSGRRLHMLIHEATGMPGRGYHTSASPLLVRSPCGESREVMAGGKSAALRGKTGWRS